MLASRLLGAYPSLNLHDAKTFAAELVGTLQKYPAWVGEQAIDKAKKASPQYVPSVPMVDVACTEVVTEMREAMDRRHKQNAAINSQLAERALIEDFNNQESPEHRRSVVERLWPRALMGAKKEREVKDTGFCRFSNEDLEKLYRRNEGEAAE